MSREVGRKLTELRRSGAAGYHQKPYDRHNSEREAIEDELELARWETDGGSLETEAGMSVIHPGTDFEDYEDPYPDDDGIVIVISPHLLNKAKGEDYVPEGDNNDPDV